MKLHSVRLAWLGLPWCRGHRIRVFPFVFSSKTFYFSRIFTPKFLVFSTGRFSSTAKSLSRWLSVLVEAFSVKKKFVFSFENCENKPSNGKHQQQVCWTLSQRLGEKSKSFVRRWWSLRHDATAKDEDFPLSLSAGHCGCRQCRWLLQGLKLFCLCFREKPFLLLVIHLTCWNCCRNISNSDVIYQTISIPRQCYGDDATDARR